MKVITKIIIFDALSFKFISKKNNLYIRSEKTNPIRILQYFIEFANQRRIDMQTTLFLK